MVEISLLAEEWTVLHVGNESTRPRNLKTKVRSTQYELPEKLRKGHSLGWVCVNRNFTDAENT